MLHLSAQQWSTVIIVVRLAFPSAVFSRRTDLVDTPLPPQFYPPYLVSEPICTFFVKKTSPSIWLTRIMVSWGYVLFPFFSRNCTNLSSSDSAVMCCMAAVKNYGGLITCRVLLGLFEGSYFTSIGSLSFFSTFAASHTDLLVLLARSLPVELLVRAR